MEKNKERKKLKLHVKKGIPKDKKPSMKKLEHPGKAGVGSSDRDVKLKKSNPQKKMKGK